MIIGTTITNLPDLPWEQLAAKNPAIHSELNDITSYISAINNDKYIGLILSGCSKAFIHLSYLCFQLSLLILGQSILNSYRGMGSTDDEIVIICELLEDVVEQREEEEAAAIVEEEVRVAEEGPETQQEDGVAHPEEQSDSDSVAVVQ